MTANETSSSEWVAIGDRIRAARVSARMSVRELARRVDVSPSHVSQVERGLASFSVRALYNVVSELGVSMDSLFDDASAPAVDEHPGQRSVNGSGTDDPLVEQGIVLRAVARPTIPLAGGTRWERLTPLSETGAEFIEVIYPPASPDGGPPVGYIQHSSREYGLIISGSLTVQVGFDTTRLNAGDSIAFDSVMPHRFWNETPHEVHAVWFILDSPHASVESQSPHLRRGNVNAP